MPNNANTLNIAQVSADNFQDLVEQINTNIISKLNTGHFLYKGDTGESPQIAQRDIYVDGEFTEMGKQLVAAIFKDIINDELTVDDIITKSTDPTSNLYGKLDFFTIPESKMVDDVLVCEYIKYPWWCADGIDYYPIFPAASFSYIDTGSKNVNNYKDYSITLTPIDIIYQDIEDGGEPIVEYSSNALYPTFYYDSSSLYGRGAWCWKINGVKTGIPASIANAEEMSTRIFMVRASETENSYDYFISTKVEGDDNTYTANTEWVEHAVLKENASVRCPVNNDLGFFFDPDAAANTLDLRIYSTSNEDEIGTWYPLSSTGDNKLITFNAQFIKFVWNTICESSVVKIGDNGISIGNYIISYIDNKLKVTSTAEVPVISSDVDIYKGDVVNANKLLTRGEVEGIIKNEIATANTLPFPGLNALIENSSLITSVPYTIPYKSGTLIVNATSGNTINPVATYIHQDKVYSVTIKLTSSNIEFISITDSNNNRCNGDYLHDSNSIDMFGEGSHDNIVTSNDYKNIKIGEKCHDCIIINSTKVSIGDSGDGITILNSANINIGANNSKVCIRDCSYINSSAAIFNAGASHVKGTSSNKIQLISGVDLSNNELHVNTVHIGDDMDSYIANNSSIYKKYVDNSITYKQNLDPVWYSAYIDTDTNPDYPIARNATQRKDVSVSITVETHKNYSKHNERMYTLKFTGSNIPNISQCPILVTLDNENDECRSNCIIGKRAADSVTVRALYVHDLSGSDKVYGQETWKGFNIMIIKNNI